MIFDMVSKKKLHFYLFCYNTSCYSHDFSISLISNFTHLTGVIHQLDVAMENVATQRGGLVFVYNMYGSKYANFDYDLSQKMLTLLKGEYNFSLI